MISKDLVKNLIDFRRIPEDVVKILINFYKNFRGLRREFHCLLMDVARKLIDSLLDSQRKFKGFGKDFARFSKKEN